MKKKYERQWQVEKPIAKDTWSGNGEKKKQIIVIKKISTKNANECEKKIECKVPDERSQKTTRDGQWQRTRVRLT